jgi:AN1-type zinc finger protein 1
LLFHRHRHPASHECKSLNNDEQRKLERKLAAQEQLAKTFSSSDTGSKKRKVIKSVPIKSKNGGMVELMKIKSQAKGNASIPASSRIYIYVQCPKESKLDSQSVYFDKVKKFSFLDILGT